MTQCTMLTVCVSDLFACWIDSNSSSNILVFFEGGGAKYNFYISIISELSHLQSSHVLRFHPAAYNNDSKYRYGVLNISNYSLISV